jgi:hypothetical protein
MAINLENGIVKVSCHLNIKYYTVTVFIGQFKGEVHFRTSREGPEWEQR